MLRPHLLFLIAALTLTPLAACGGASELFVPDAERAEELDGDTPADDDDLIFDDASVADPEEPDANIPDADIPDADIPDANVPDADIPDANLPDADVPDADVPDADVPDADVPDADVPDADIPDADVPDADVPDAGPVDPDPACGECITTCETVTEICDDICEEIPADSSGCPAFCDELGVCQLVCEDATMICPYLCEPGDFLCNISCNLLAGSTCVQLCQSQCAGTICNFGIDLCDRDPCTTVRTICETQCPCD